MFQIPTLTATPNNLNSGESLTLKCDAFPTKNIAYKFRKGTANLTQFQSSDRHTIVPARSTDSGLYTCIAQGNNVEKESSKVNVNGMWLFIASLKISLLLYL